jgi:menaquinone-dependent protoporphyrinogen oxidase
MSARAADGGGLEAWLADGMSHHIAGPTRVLEDANVLVVYASTHGHTAEIATRLADTMRADGLAVDLRDVAHADDVRPERYDLVVAGASLHKHEHQKAMRDWVSASRTALSQIPSVFLSVSLSAADDGEEAHAATQQCIDDFCAKTGWTPTRTQRIAGCLQYREYDVFTRQLMRLLMKRMGRPTDASQDYDYTDWDGVERLGHELAVMVARPAAAM